MTKNKINFEIIPIFDQSADSRIWHDFTEIELKCDSEKYNYHVDDSDRCRIYKSHMYDWTHCKNNMSFAAYSGEQMVGFATAYKEKSGMYLRNLYVNPSFNGMGIGHQLLDKTEKASALVSDLMELVSLNGAVTFYESHGYTNFDNRTMNKKLPESVIGVVPVFKWYKSLRAQIKLDVDNSLLIHNKNQPIFVYVAPGREIVGVAVRTTENKDVIWTSNKNGKEMACFYENQLLKALSKIR